MASDFFPPAAAASSDGLVGVGGDLQIDRLLDAYRHGIFPWPTDQHMPMLWWSPDPRAILPLDGLHVSKRLTRRLRSPAYHGTCDQDFESVIRACSEGPGREEGTWLTPKMIRAYQQLHAQGHAHSVELWEADQLVGGVYGVAIGGVFAAESMFHRVRDGSKMAVYHLVEHLKSRGYQLLDIQQWTDHTGSLGAIEIDRAEYLQILSKLVDQPITFGTTLESQSPS